MFWHATLLQLKKNGVSLIAQVVKNPPAVQETPVSFLGGEDPLEKRMATHSSIQAWSIPWMVQSMGSRTVGHDSVTFTSFFLRSFVEIVYKPYNSLI